jgi:opacity protein-like surface antigen
MVSHPDTPRLKTTFWYVAFTSALLTTSGAFAADPAENGTTTGLGAETPAKPKPPPYSLPWQLRPAAAANVIRSDTTFASYDPALGDQDRGFTIASMLLGSYKITADLAVMARVGLVSNSPPDSANTLESSTLFLNPVLGATYVITPVPSLRIAPFLGVAFPLGGGGGDSPEPSDAQALGRGVLARSAMDNAMFATNYLTPFPGVGIAWVQSGLTVQAEVTLLQLMRVRGSDHPADSKDSSRTNLTTGLHVGYFVVPQLSIGAEWRYQRFLKNQAIDDLPDGDTRVDNMTVAIGPRVHIQLAETTWLRPGIAYAMALDDPMDADEYRIVQLDVPVAF